MPGASNKFDVTHHLIRQLGIVILGGGLMLMRALRPDTLSEWYFLTLFGAVIAGRTVEHFRSRPTERIDRRLMDAVQRVAMANDPAEQQQWVVILRRLVREPEM